jgi:hypothetical protein
MVIMTNNRRTLKLKPDIEYQVVWSETFSLWEIYRNGTKTNFARRKMKSALDRAIIAIQSELTSPTLRAVVCSFKDGIKKIEWTRHPLRSEPGQ